MLVLSRKVGEKIMLGDRVVVQVTKIVGNKVCIGIEAPESLLIYREEIWNTKRKKKKSKSKKSR
ncbi:MAG: carbon storage regulator [Acidobacteria bacterium]|nr:carbon storage regulator [Acidobacteriota bacterium]